MDFIKQTRGFRNNNPGNIRHGSPWIGLSPRQNDDHFCQFISVEYGIRAIFRVLNTYYQQYAISNIHDIIHRYAPPEDNPTYDYIKSVTSYINDHLTTPINNQESVWEREIVDLVVMAIIHHENGYNPFALNFVQDCRYVN